MNEAANIMSETFKTGILAGRQMMSINEGDPGKASEVPTLNRFKNSSCVVDTSSIGVDIGRYTGSS